jgi:hypothetical protein
MQPIGERCHRNSSKIQPKAGKKYIQQGLEIRGFWLQKKTVQLKTALYEV